MKITLVVLSSVDGKTTKWNEKDIHSWASDEDQEQFFSLIRKQHLIFMGSSTYEAAKPIIKLSPKILRIVFTKNPDKYEKDTAVGELEFSNEVPSVLIKKLEQKGHKKALLLGGAELGSSFFREGLVNEILLTVEPRLFGKGNGIINEMQDQHLRLISLKKLNKQGTLLLKYKSLRNTQI